MSSTCICGCARADAGATHAVMAALATGDLGRALDAGLLDCLPCPDCDARCTATLLAARLERQRALAARERFRARSARLLRRAEERNAQRSPAPTATPQAPALPAAAAAALARAQARAAQRGDR